MITGSSTVAERPRASRAQLAAVCACAIALLGAACGKKGPPLPPLPNFPVAPGDVSATRRGDEVAIRFTVPGANASGVTPADIGRVDVYAWTGPALTAADAFRYASVVASVPVRRPPPPAEPADEGEPAPPPPPPPTGPGLDQGAVGLLTEVLGPAAFEPIAVKKDDADDRDGAPRLAAVRRSDALGYGLPALTPPDAGPPLPPPPTRHYVVVGVTRGGRRGTPSAVQAVPLWPAPPPPAGLAAKVREGAVDLSWTAPAGLREPVQPNALPAPAATPAGRPGQKPRAPATRPPAGSPAGAAAPAAATDRTKDAAPPPPGGETGASSPAQAAPGPAGTGEPMAPLRGRLLVPWPASTSGYKVYEVPAPGRTPAPAPGAAPALPAALTAAPIDATRFTDPRLELGVERCYTVRTVATVGAQSVESAAAEPVCVKPTDVFAPAAPASLAAVAGEGVISLIWEANREPDLAGYLVYRGIAPGETLERITPKPIRETTYRDTAVKPGERYVYAVVAVDTAEPPNASPQSNRVEEAAR